MTNQMLVFGGNHNGINCIQKTDAERPCDKIWFTAKQIEEWSGMTNRTLHRRLKLLEEKGRICNCLDLKKCEIPTNNGGFIETTFYNLNVLNQLAVVEYKNNKLNDVYKQLNNLAEDYSDVDSLHYLDHPIYYVAENVHRYSLRLENVFGCMLEDTLCEFDLSVERQYKCGKYRIDFYIPEINTCIEYDEHNHAGYNQAKEINRLKYITDQLRCDIIHLTEENSHATNIGIVLRKIIDKIDLKNSIGVK